MAKPRDQGMVRVSLFLRRDQIDAMRAEQERVGVVQAEQIRRAIDAALEPEIRANTAFPGPFFDSSKRMPVNGFASRTLYVIGFHFEVGMSFVSSKVPSP